MSSRPVDMVQLELLVAVAETGSLGAAAVRYGLTQPAVSMRMTALERTLGLQLLRREPSGTSLTPAGHEVLAAARAVLDAGAALTAAAERLRADVAAHLRVAASFTVAEHLVPAWIETLHAAAPDVALTLEVLNSSQVLAAVDQRRVDVGFVEGPDEPSPDRDERAVATDELVVVVAPSHPWARRRGPLTGPELAAADLVVRERGSGTRAVLDQALRPWGGTRSRLELGSSTAVLAAAINGEGPAVLSRLAADGDVASGRLCQVAVSGLSLSRTIRAVWRSDGGLGPLAAHLVAAASQVSGAER
ncbi:MAG: LysR family transcriptional regulator [Actinomycetota bacterium]|nr:LysR family transcriptional regulator [Actinomycetota bacterium]